MSLYAIPDIHGRLDLLEQLWKKLGANFPNDHVVFLGDYIDRGPHSKDVLAWLRNLQTQYPENITCLLGNHDDFMLQSVAAGPLSQVFQTWCLRKNGGYKTLQSYGFYYDGTWEEEFGRQFFQATYDDCTWLLSLPLYCDKYDGFFFSHAPLSTVSRSQLPWARDNYIWSYLDDWPEDRQCYVHPGRVAVCGHLNQLNRGIYLPRFYNQHIFADAGCGCIYAAPLVAINVETRDVIAAYPPIIETIESPQGTGEYYEQTMLR